MCAFMHETNYGMNGWNELKDARANAWHLCMNAACKMNEWNGMEWKCNEWVNQWVNDFMNEWMNERTNESMNGCSGWINEGLKELMVWSEMKGMDECNEWRMKERWNR